MTGVGNMTVLTAEPVTVDEVTEEPGRFRLPGEDETEALQAWRGRVVTCPVGAELGIELGCRPPRPWVLDPGADPVTAAAGWAGWGSPVTVLGLGRDAARYEWNQALLDTVIQFRRQAAHCAAQALIAVNELAVNYCGLRENLANEIAVAMRITDGEAELSVGDAWRLTDELTGTLAALNTGRISWDVASAVLTATDTTAAATAALVEARILPDIHRLTKRSVLRRCTRWVAQYDAAGFAARKKKAAHDRGMSRRLGADGMASLNMYGPVEDIAALWQAEGVRWSV